MGEHFINVRNYSRTRSPVRCGGICLSIASPHPPCEYSLGLRLAIARRRSGPNFIEVRKLEMEIPVKSTPAVCMCGRVFQALLWAWRYRMRRGSCAWWMICKICRHLLSPTPELEVTLLDKRIFVDVLNNFFSGFIDLF